jgi:hypothetical protein
MKLSILISLLCVLPIIGMEGVPEQTTTEFSEECLDKCGPGFAGGGLAGICLGACIGIPVGFAIGNPAITVTILIMFGCAAAGTGYGSLIATTCFMKPGTPTRIIRRLNNTNQPELTNVVIQK